MPEDYDDDGGDGVTAAIVSVLVVESDRDADVCAGEMLILKIVAAVVVVSCDAVVGCCGQFPMVNYY